MSFTRQSDLNMKVFFCGVRTALNEFSLSIMIEECVVCFQVDSSTESAEAACDILSQLVNCSLKTLGLISTARPSFMELPKVSPALSGSPLVPLARDIVYVKRLCFLSSVSFHLCLDGGVRQL